MIISELIKQLKAIRDEHGDVVVMHHDDWSDFVVDQVEFVDGSKVNSFGEFDAPCVLLTGSTIISDFKGGWDDISRKRSE